MSTNNYIAKLKLRLDQAIIQRDHWKQLAENRNSIVVTEVCPESRSVEEYVIDADSVRASWRLIREYREQIEALRAAERDAARIEWLASQCEMRYGHREHAQYSADFGIFFQSDRDQCRPCDFRAAIDAEMEGEQQ